MASPVSSEPVRYFDRSGERINAPLEWEPAFVQVPVSDTGWEAARVTLQGQPLEISRRQLDGAIRTVAEWPRSGPGNYRLRVSTNDVSWRRTVSVEPSRIDSAAFRQLIDDLESRLPASIALRLQRMGALTGLREVDPDENTLDQELTRLRRAVRGRASHGGGLGPGLAEVLRHLAGNHHRILVTEEKWMRRERARRPSPSGLIAALAHPQNLERDDSFPRGAVPRRVPDVRVRHTPDVYENRLVFAFWREVDLRLRHLRIAFESQGRSDPTDETRRLMDELTAARRQAAFLDDVSPPKQPLTRVTMVLLKNSSYRAALKGYRALHRDVRVVHREPKLQAPLRNLPDLYQIWASLIVFDALLAVGEDHGFRVERQRLVRSGRRTGFVRLLPDGKAVLELAHRSRPMRVRAIPERSYSKAGPVYRSFTRTQVPDVAVEVEERGRPASVVVFDPKYRFEGQDDDGPSTPMAKKADLDRMHAYRDAIRDAEGHRVVRYAATLYPGPTEDYEGRLAALCAIPGSSHELEEELRGVFASLLGSDSVGNAGLYAEVRTGSEGARL